MPEEATEFRLIHKERTGQSIFFFASILAIISTFQAERYLTSKLLKIDSEPDYASYTIALFSWLYFASSLVIAHVAIVRLFLLTKEANSEADSDITPLLLKGSQITTIGDIFKVIGYGLAAIGNQLQTNSLIESSLSTPRE